MEEKKASKISLSTFFLILAILVIIVMAYFIYKFYNEKTIETEKVSDLNSQVKNLQETIDSISNQKTEELTEEKKKEIFEKINSFDKDFLNNMIDNKDYSTS